MHQEDCLKSARNGVKHGATVLVTLRSWMETHNAEQPSLWDGGIPFQDRVEKIQKDMDFLDSQLTQLGSDIQESKELLRQYFQLSQDMTMFRLTILAAIFLPLSFATSLFGMNMNSLTVEGPLGFSTWMNETLEALPTDSRKATEAILSIIGTSGTLSYNWKTFGITAGCLLLSLPLSLMIGTILRAIVIWATQSAKYWRYVAVVGAVCFVVFSIFGADFPLYPCLILSWICNGSLMLYTLWKVYRSWITKQRPIFWTTFSALLSVCITLNVFGFGFSMLPFDFLPMLVAWFYLAFPYLYKRVREFFRSRRLRRET